jgi:hypothetical protein
MPPLTDPDEGVPRQVFRCGSKEIVVAMTSSLPAILATVGSSELALRFHSEMALGLKIVEANTSVPRSYRSFFIVF